MRIWTLDLANGALCDETGATAATLSHVNLLTDHPSTDGDRPVVVWSGWTGEILGLHAQGACFAPSASNWRPETWEVMRAMLDRMSDSLGPDRFWVRPHARHVMSDAQSCLSEVRRWAERKDQGQSVPRLLLDPAMLLTAEMLGAAEDHVVRALDALAAHELCCGLVVSDVELVEPAGTSDGPAMGPELRPVPIGSEVGALGVDVLPAALEAAGVKPELVVVMAGADAEEQVRRVGLG